MQEAMYIGIRASTSMDVWKAHKAEPPPWLGGGAVSIGLPGCELQVRRQLDVQIQEAGDEAPEVPVRLFVVHVPPSHVRPEDFWPGMVASSRPRHQRSAEGSTGDEHPRRVYGLREGAPDPHGTRSGTNAAYAPGDPRKCPRGVTHRGEIRADLPLWEPFRPPPVP
jgi:hypothetical protein